LITTILFTSFFVYLIYEIRKSSDEKRNLREESKKSSLISLAAYLLVLFLCVLIIVIKFDFHFETTDQYLEQSANAKTIMASFKYRIIFICLVIVTFAVAIRFKGSFKLMFISVFMLYAIYFNASFKSVGVSKSFFCEKMESSSNNLKR
jgi:hypothetical protein